MICVYFSFTAPDYLHGKRKGLFFASHVEERGDGHDRDSRDDASVDTTTTSAHTRVENARRRRRRKRQNLFVDVTTRVKSILRLIKGRDVTRYTDASVRPTRTVLTHDTRLGLGKTAFCVRIGFVCPIRTV